MSASRTVTLNAAAVALFGAALASAPKIRVRAGTDGAIEIRPTARVSAVNLPKTEALRDLRVKDNSRRFSVTNLDLNVGAAYTMDAGKYGWFRLTPAPVGTVGAAGARVSDR